MKQEKKERLKKAGWKVGTTKEFLQLTAEEAALIEIKLALARSLKKRRIAQKMTQDELAKELGIESIASRENGIGRCDGFFGVVGAISVGVGGQSSRHRPYHRKEAGEIGSITGRKRIGVEWDQFLWRAASRQPELRFPPMFDTRTF